MRRIYLDNAATTPLLPEVRDFLCRVLEVFGNPSSLHALGEEARELLEMARENVASLLGVEPECIVFNSCATEGNNTVVFGAVGERRGNLVISAIEHKSVAVPARHLSRRGVEVREVRVDRNGLVDLDHLRDLLDEDTLLVSVVYVSNEFGTLQPVEEIAGICKERGVPFHTDAVQAVGKVRVNLEGVSFATFSAHKFHGPKGVGFLYTALPLEPLIWGGGQERNLRSGTENLPGILAMTKALEVVMENLQEFTSRLKRLRDRFEEALLEALPDAVVIGREVPRSPAISTVIFPRATGREIVRRLSERGVMCSAGSACSSGEDLPNPHLLAMGYTPEEALRAVRFSFGLLNTEEEVEEAVRLIRSLF
jgi:cysteine desulfurase